LAHVSGEWAEASYPLKLDQPPQQFGSSLTYGRRYSLQSLLCLAAEDDDGAAAEVKPLAKKKLAAANTSPIVTRPTAKPSDKTISDTQRRKLFAVAAAHGWTEHEWREQMDRGFGCLSTKQLQPEDYEQLLAILQRRPRVQTDGVSEPQ
jgi:predicted nucleic acid-binding Zn ribbon protein